MENMRFRDVELTFRVSEQENENALLGGESDDKAVYKYPSMTKSFGPFTLEIEGGAFKPSEIMMMLG